MKKSNNQSTVIVYLICIICILSCTYLNSNKTEINSKKEKFKSNYNNLMYIKDNLQKSYKTFFLKNKYQNVKFFDGKYNKIIRNIVYDSSLVIPFKKFGIGEIDFNFTDSAKLIVVVFFDDENPNLVFRCYSDSTQRLLKKREDFFENKYVYIEKLNPFCEIEYTK